MEELTYLKSVLIGIFQGLTEFLPVSSSGHIMLLNECFNVNLEGDALGLFTVMLHLGTLLAVLIVYIKRVFNMIAHPVKSELGLLVLATLPTVAYALALKATGLDDVIDAGARLILPFAFIFTGIILLFAGRIGKLRHKAGTAHKNIGVKDALGMGLMQCIGTFSGVSRSGSTITGGLLAGLNRKQAADFSFLMSIPAILGALVLDAMDMHVSGIAAAFEGHWAIVGAGVLAAFIAGLAAIKIMLNAIKKLRFKWFSLYLFLLGAVIVVNDYIVKIW